MNRNRLDKSKETKWWNSLLWKIKISTFYQTKISHLLNIKRSKSNKSNKWRPDVKIWRSDVEAQHSCSRFLKKSKCSTQQLTRFQVVQFYYRLIHNADFDVLKADIDSDTIIDNNADDIFDNLLIIEDAEVEGIEGNSTDYD